MLKYLSIQALHSLARAEEEGVSVAYEYFTRRLVLAPWLRSLGRPRRILIAGLPDKRGSSLDFLQLAAECGATVTVVDDRPQALTRLRRAWQAAQAHGRLIAVHPSLVHTDSVAELTAIAGRFDLSLSAQVLQRLNPTWRALYFNRLQRLASAVALFAPNGDNTAHTAASGVAGVRREEMNGLIKATALVPDQPPPQTGYLNLLPFSPAVGRSPGQDAATDADPLTVAAMGGLQLLGHLERLLPLALRRQQARGIYVFSAGAGR